MGGWVITERTAILNHHLDMTGLQNLPEDERLGFFPPFP